MDTSRAYWLSHAGESPVILRATVDLGPTDAA